MYQDIGPSVADLPDGHENTDEPLPPGVTPPTGLTGMEFLSLPVSIETIACQRADELAENSALPGQPAEFFVVMTRYGSTYNARFLVARGVEPSDDSTKWTVVYRVTGTVR